jgi:3-hydroxybutyryl-CoA dehydrogenase
VTERLGIAGSGAIACGLAAVASSQGDVLLWARSDASAKRFRAKLAKLLERYEEGRGDAVRVTTDPGDLAAATFVVEAIVEDTDAKCALARRLGERLPEATLMGTTTSSLPISALASASGRPDRYVGLHVFNPVTKMELVELTFPDGAAADTRARAREFCVSLGKTAVEVPDVPGFVVNRLLFPYLFDAVRLLERTGLEPEEIDTCMRMGAGHPMGPLALLDLVGLDVAQAIGEAIEAEIPDRLRSLIADGALGRKAGRGFHAY